MSTVYRAEDLQLGRDVAVKVFLQDVTGAGDDRRRAEEVRTLAGLSHPALVTLFDADTAHDPPYFVMELVDGGTLSDRMREGLVPADQLRAIATAVADALDYVHARGVVHRDVKPGNVLLPRSVTATTARARLADFGIARLVDATRLTSDGTLIGTAAYLSPEQARGAQVAAPSDVYSLGLLLLEALTGERAFPGTPLESASARIHRSPRIPDDLTPEWRKLLTRMTAMEADDRPTARSVVLELGRMRDAVAPEPTRVLPVADGAITGGAPTAADELERTAPMTVADAAALRADEGTPTVATEALSSAADHATIATPLEDTQHDPRPRRRRPARALIAAGGVVAVTVAVLLVAFLGPVGDSGPAPDYPEVAGDLGTHLERLQESVAP